MDGSDQSSIGGEPVGTLEGREVSCGDQKLCPEDRTHTRQASEDRGLRTGEKTLPNLLVDALDAIFEGEDLFGELANDAGGDVFGGQGNALGSGRLESLAGDVFGALDTAVSKVSSEALATHPADLCRFVVVGNEREGALPIQVQCSLQGWEQRQECLFETDDGPLWSVTRSRR